MLSIDLHTHILPETWPSWTQKSGYAGWVELAHDPAKRGCARMQKTTSVDDSSPPQFFREIGCNCWDPPTRQQEMAATGVMAQVLSTVPVMFSYWSRPQDAYDLARLLNDHIATTCRGAPEAPCTMYSPSGTRVLKSFMALGTVPLQDMDFACRELERCVRDLGMPGVQIGTHVNGTDLGDPALRPFFACAERLNACVFVHPWDMLAPERMQKYWAPWLVGMPAETCLAMCSVIFGGLLEHCPRLRLCFAHAGGSFPGTFGRIRHGFLARPDLVAVDNQRDPAEYLARADGTPARLWVDSLTHDEEALRAVLKMFGERRVCMGSDYPFPLGEERPGEMIRAMNWGEAVESRLLVENAIEFLGV